MVSEKCILIIQVFASFFMGLDYFLTETQRDRFNRFLKSHLHPLLDSEELYLAAKLEQAKRSWASIILVLLLFFGSLLVIRYITPAMEQWVNLWFLLAVITLVFLTLLANSIKIFDVAFKEGVPIVFSLLKSLVARFLINCPKGTGFGVGFVLLVISFICRGTNISW
ncbi:hypothetical protein POF45_28020 [Pseudomonas sp. 681]|uniref:Uncharacterized protein n=1 Tax=Pseudomonas fungipugnans TaxID=3024217 RepID=A0ABT6QWF1_9PSED|nr:hypothetical protein [Pseudomonas sp. 681]MDI2595240.1 hypothetical protein [Pseudomonas sp. 681]